MADLKDSVALVTNANRSMGRGIAHGLAEAGATVYLAAGNDSEEEPAISKALQATVAEARELGGKGIPMIVDLADDAAVLDLFRHIESQAGRLDLLVNNACQTPDPAAGPMSFWSQPLSVWDEQCGVTLRSCYVVAALGARMMVEQCSGLIINLCGDPAGEVSAGHRPGTAWGVCCAAVDRMARGMAGELSTHGVAAVSLAAGPIRTQQNGQTALRDGHDLSPDVFRSPRYLGRCIAALAMDPDVLEKNGDRLEIEMLQREYRFSELSAEAGL